ncbi:hypothetical protein PE36_08026 [Moritella sp. PE36]|uniref:tetratricopeptide repeat protein n=1 Tax=Moritella sp. PE36 TaxID=58051 RepID=UPI0001568C89|nr:tetratricopeptide repeat protein [Moritella sp. PE36]EDM65933.1 hypothetical protein PE36_08026 [Moritella sp. PE36]
MLKKIIEKQEFSSQLLFEVCSKQLESTPDCHYTHYLLGRHFQDLEEWRGAIKHFKQSLLLDHSELGVWQGLHNSLISYGGVAKGLEEFSSFINRELYSKLDIEELDGDMLLFRVVETKHVESFTVEEQGRFSPTKNYRKPKEDGPWCDLHENRPHQAVKVENVKLSGLDLKLMELSIGGLYHVLCFTRVSKANVESFRKLYNINKFQEDSSKEYSVIVINDSKEFLRRVVGLHPRMEFGGVWYLPTDVVERSNGVLFPFIKGKKYAKEFEFRLATQHVKSLTLGESVYLNMGRLDDISEVVKPSEILEYVENRFK